MEYTAEFLTQLYRNLLSVRLFEEKQVELYALGKVPGHIHSGIGEEGSCTGVFATHKEGDYFKISHRPVGAGLLAGTPLETMFAELMGRVSGNALGLGGVLHMSSLSSGMLGFSGTLGCDAAVADGAALTIQMSGTDNVAYVFYGDGTSNRGPIHEAMNLAAIWKLPVLFVCNNNQYAISTPATYSSPVANPGADRAAAYGMPTRIADGNDVLAVYEAASELVAGIRAGNGPAVLECKMCRMRGHFEGDQQKYRDLSVVEEWKEKDCIARMEKYLQDNGVLTADEIQAIRDELNAKMEAAIAAADLSPEPTPDDLYRNLFAE